MAEQVVHVFVADQPTCATFEVDAEADVEKQVLVEKMERYENDKWNHQRCSCFLFCLESDLTVWKHFDCHGNEIYRQTSQEEELRKFTEVKEVECIAFEICHFCVILNYDLN